MSGAPFTTSSHRQRQTGGWQRGSTASTGAACGDIHRIHRQRRLVIVGGEARSANRTKWSSQPAQRQQQRTNGGTVVAEAPRAAPVPQQQAAQQPQQQLPAVDSAHDLVRSQPDVPGWLAGGHTLCVDSAGSGCLTPPGGGCAWQQWCGSATTALLLGCCERVYAVLCASFTTTTRATRNAARRCGSVRRRCSRCLRRLTHASRATCCACRRPSRSSA